MSNDQAVSIAHRSAPLTDDQVELIKRTICKGASDDELAMFMQVANRRGLDPFLGQVHAVKRKQKNDDGTWGETMSIQVGIDGLRLVAERTGNYVPSEREPRFDYDPEGNLEKATVWVKKYHPASNTWHDVPGVAHFAEYVQMRGKWKGKEKVGEEPNRMWGEKPHIMIGKCAEAIALRKAFPNETSGLYIDEEFQRSDTVETDTKPAIGMPERKSEAPKQVEATHENGKPEAEVLLTADQQEIIRVTCKTKGIGQKSLLKFLNWGLGGEETDVNEALAKTPAKHLPELVEWFEKVDHSKNAE